LSGPKGNKVTQLSEAMASIWEARDNSPRCHPEQSDDLRTTEGWPRKPPVRGGSALLCTA
jgi:hypothetical protein